MDFKEIAQEYGEIELQIRELHAKKEELKAQLIEAAKLSDDKRTRSVEFVRFSVSVYTQRRKRKSLKPEHEWDKVHLRRHQEIASMLKNLSKEQQEIESRYTIEEIKEIVAVKVSPKF